MEEEIVVQAVTMAALYLRIGTDWAAEEDWWGRKRKTEGACQQ